MNVNFFGDLNLNGNDIINVSKIIGMNGKWEIGEDGTLRARKVVVEELEVGSQNKPIGVTIFDEATGEPVCVKSINKNLILAEGKCILGTASAISSTPIIPQAEPATAVASTTETLSITETATSTATNTSL